MRLPKGKSSFELDSYDLAILKLLQQDNAVPQRAIGEAVNLSAAAVQRRITRLQQSGVIERNVAVLNPARVGQPITLIVAVEIESERLDLLEASKASFLAAEEVQQCYYVTGDTDFILVITVQNMLAYEQLTRRLFFENHNIKHFKTFVAMDRIKTSTHLALPE